MMIMRGKRKSHIHAHEFMYDECVVTCLIISLVRPCTHSIAQPAF
jgi:hypothetical protein